MRKLTLVGNRLLTDTEKGEIRLEYYLLEETRDVSNYMPLYGMRIMKWSKASDGILREQKTAAAISYSKEFVLEILNQFIQNLVTPMCMLELVDEKVSQEYCQDIPRIG